MKKNNFKTLFIAFALIAITLQPVQTKNLDTEYIDITKEYGDPLKKNLNILDTLSFNDLVVISEQEDTTENLESRIDYVLNNAAVDNSINKDARVVNENEFIGKYIRAIVWNIERGMELDLMIDIFNNPDKMKAKIDKENPYVASRVKNEIDYIRKADVLMLTEVDAGMPRTKYRNIAEEFAKAIGYNYVYAPEFLEVDPSHLGLETFKWSEEAVLFPDGLVVDEDKYKGLHGTAILSRFPLKNVEVLRLPKVYNWYTEERIRLNRLEILRRRASARFFKEAIIREIRYGSRIAILADVIMPDVKEPVTLVAAHLENRTQPKNRQLQMKYVLDNIYDRANPVIIGGDFNTAIADAAPVNTKKKKTRFSRLVERLKVYNLPAKLVIKPVMAVPNTFRKMQDPSIKNIPIFMPNPERGLFSMIKNFKFIDGNCFDHRSTKGKVLGHGGNLANANMRNFKGFVPTWKFDRNFYVGRFKLDWLFVKAYCNSPNGPECSFKMAPHFGATLFDLNYGFDENLSDHTPIGVDLPVEEPPVMTKSERKEFKKELKTLKKRKDKDAIKELKKEKKRLKQEGYQPVKKKEKHMSI